MGWSGELREVVRQRALEAGFDRVGVTGAYGPEDAAGAESAERFAAWVEAGHAGEMEYLKRRDEAGVLLRSGVRTAVPWARSVVVCAMNYNGAGPRSVDDVEPGRGWIARYAWNGAVAEDGRVVPVDYHDDMLARLRMVEAVLREKAKCETRCYVDTGPILERDVAVKAGIGWVGKNTCVIDQQMGSWLLLGVIVTSLEVDEAGVQMAPDRCGSCTRCIDACPTDALAQSREGERAMDAARCIAYLTIEKKGSIVEELREAMGRHVFGCDICQEVCPWNRRAPIAAKAGLVVREELVNPALEWLAGMGDAQFGAAFRGSPLERTKRRRVQRNVAIAMGNSGDGRFAPQLEMWRDGNDEVLAEAAGWSLRRLRDEDEG